MQVILTKDVARVGRQYDVVEVSSGYATNFLFPQKLAERATKAGISVLEKRREKLEAQEKVREEELTEKFKVLEGAVLPVTVKSDEQGNLYKKINSADIVSALQKELSLELPETSIFLETPIDKTGEHTVAIEHKDKKASITVNVIRE